MSDQLERRVPDSDANADKVVPPEDLESLSPDALRDRWLRAAAELDTLRRRTARDLETARRHERADVLRGVLPVLDSLERAIDAAGDRDDDWVKGLVGIQAQMLATLRQFGAEPFDASGELFDPERHEAVATVADPSRRDGAVAEVLQTGHQMADGTILRAAKVTVVRNS